MQLTFSVELVRIDSPALAFIFERTHRKYEDEIEIDK
jgi:hypothetical protein